MRKLLLGLLLCIIPSVATATGNRAIYNETKATNVFEVRSGSTVWTDELYITASSQTYIVRTYINGKTGEIYANRLLIDNPIDSSKVNVASSPTGSFQTLQDWMDNTQSAGLLQGYAKITNNGDGTISVSSGIGIIKESNAINARTKFITFAAKNNIVIPTETLTYVYVEYNNGNPIVSTTTSRTAIHDTDHFILGRVYYQDANINDMSIIASQPYVSNFARNVHEKMINTSPIERSSGGLVSELDTRKLQATAGVFYTGMSKINIPAINTGGTDSFTYYSRTSSYTWRACTACVTVDNLNYDNGTSTVPLTANRYGVHWVYICMDGHLDVVYGQGDYKLTEAQTALPPTSLPGYLQTFAVLAAKVIVQQGGTNFTSIQSAYTTVFPIPSTGIEHNNLSGLQGGALSEYYHLTTTQHGELTTGTISPSFTARSSATVIGNGMVSNNFDVGQTFSGHDAVLSGSATIMGNVFVGSGSISIYQLNNALGNGLRIYGKDRTKYLDIFNDDGSGGIDFAFDAVGQLKFKDLIYANEGALIATGKSLYFGDSTEYTLRRNSAGNTLTLSAGTVVISTITRDLVDIWNNVNIGQLISAHDGVFSGSMSVAGIGTFGTGSIIGYEKFSTNVALSVSGRNNTNYASKYPMNMVLIDTAPFAGDVGGGIVFAGDDGSVTTRWFSGFHGGKENGISGDYSGYLGFYTRPNGSDFVERMRIGSTGNLGIGTTMPMYLLDVNGNANIVQTTYGKHAIFSSSINVQGTGNYLSGTAPTGGNFFTSYVTKMHNTQMNTDNSLLDLSGNDNGGTYLRIWRDTKCIGGHWSNGTRYEIGGSTSIAFNKIAGSGYMGTGVRYRFMDFDAGADYWYHGGNKLYTSTATASSWSFPNNTNTGQTTYGKNAVFTSSMAVSSIDIHDNALSSGTSYYRYTSGLNYAGALIYGSSVGSDLIALAIGNTPINNNLSDSTRVSAEFKMSSTARRGAKISAVKRGVYDGAPTANSGLEFYVATADAYTRGLFIDSGNTIYINEGVNVSTWTASTLDLNGNLKVKEDLTTQFLNITGSTKPWTNEWISSKRVSISSFVVNAGHDNLQEFINSYSVGAVTQARIWDLTENNRTIGVSSGTGFLRRTDNEYDELIPCTFSSQTVTLTDGINYIYADYNGGNPTLNASPTLVINETKIPIGYVFSKTLFDGRIANEIVEGGTHLNDFHLRDYERLVYRGIERAQGAEISESLYGGLAVTAGVFYRGNKKIETPGGTYSTSSSSFTYYVSSSAVANTWKVYKSSSIDLSHYDNGDGTVSRLSAVNRYGVHDIYVCLEGNIYVVMGRGNYTQDQALVAPIVTPPTYLQNFAKLAARVICARDVAAPMYSVATAYQTLFPVNQVPDHESLSGLLGGGTDDHYHLTGTQAGELTTGTMSPAFTARSSATVIGMFEVRGSTFLINTIGNVGIGIAPGTGGIKLVIDGRGGNSNTIFRVQRDYTNATTTSRGGEINFIPATANTLPHASTGGVITTSYWGDASEGRLTLNAYNQIGQLVLHEGGNVGVGKEVPGVKLDVLGTIRAIGDNSFGPMMAYEGNPKYGSVLYMPVDIGSTMSAMRIANYYKTGTTVGGYIDIASASDTATYATNPNTLTYSSLMRLSTLAGTEIRTALAVDGMTTLKSSVTVVAGSGIPNTGYILNVTSQSGTSLFRVTNDGNVAFLKDLSGATINITGNITSSGGNAIVNGLYGQSYTTVNSVVSDGANGWQYTGSTPDTGMHKFITKMGTQLIVASSYTAFGRTIEKSTYSAVTGDWEFGNNTNTTETLIGKHANFSSSVTVAGTFSVGYSSPGYQAYIGGFTNGLGVMVDAGTTSNFFDLTTTPGSGAGNSVQFGFVNALTGGRAGYIQYNLLNNALAYRVNGVTVASTTSSEHFFGNNTTTAETSQARYGVFTGSIMVMGAGSNFRGLVTISTSTDGVGRKIYFTQSSGDPAINADGAFKMLQTVTYASGSSYPSGVGSYSGDLSSFVQYEQNVSSRRYYIFRSTSVGANTAQGHLALVISTGGNVAVGQYPPHTPSSGNFYVDNALSVGTSVTYRSADWSGGNVVYIPLNGNVQNYVNNCMDGDTFILSAGTYTLTTPLTINMAINIVGQGVGSTFIHQSGDDNAVIVTTSGVRLSNMTFGTSATTNGKDILSISAGDFVNGEVVVDNVVVQCSTAGNKTGIEISCPTNAGKFKAVLNNVRTYLGEFGTANLVGVYVGNCQMDMHNSNIHIYSGENNYGLYVAVNSTVNVYNCTSLTYGGPGTEAGLKTLNGSLVNAYNSTFYGTDYSISSENTSLINLYDCTLINPVSKEDTSIILYKGEVVADTFSAQTKFVVGNGVVNSTITASASGFPGIVTCGNITSISGVRVDLSTSTAQQGYVYKVFPDSCSWGADGGSGGGAPVYPGIEIPASAFRTAAFGDRAALVEQSFAATFHGVVSTMTESYLYLPAGAEPNFGWAQRIVPGTLPDSILTGVITYTSSGPVAVADHEFLQVSVSTNNFMHWTVYETTAVIANALAWEVNTATISIAAGSLFQAGAPLNISVSRSNKVNGRDIYLKGVYVYKP